MLQHLTKKKSFLKSHFCALCISTILHCFSFGIKSQVQHSYIVHNMTHTLSHNPTQPNISQKDQKKTKIVQWFGVMWSKRQHAVKNESPKPKESLNVWASCRSFPHRRVLYWQLQGTSFSFASPHTSQNQWWECVSYSSSCRWDYMLQQAT